MGKIVDIRGPVVDEFGELERRIAEFKPTLQRHETLKKQIGAWFEDAPADEPATVEGKLYLVQASPKSHKTEIKSIPALFKRLGKALFVEVCTVPLSAVRSCLPEAEHEKFLKESRSGSRTIKAVAKAPAGIAA